MSPSCNPAAITAGPQFVLGSTRARAELAHICAELKRRLAARQSYNLTAPALHYATGLAQATNHLLRFGPPQQQPSLGSPAAAVTIRELPTGTSCFNVICVQCENGKSISPIDSAQPTMAHDADTDSDLARPPDGKHPSARNATPAMLLRSATRRRTAGHVVAHPGPSDSE